MTAFAPVAASATTAPLDPSKHVNYTLGMVLGVDDFNQEFAYLAGRDRRLARDLIGYGTVSGLELAVEDAGADGPRLRVSPGVALAESGQLICVEPAQCALLNAWLDENRADVETRLTSPHSDRLSLYLVLCYRACPTDDVPIPGEPCRSEDDLMEPSRLQDDFTLELRFDPPPQVEEEGIRAFVHWLGQVEVVEGVSPLQDDLAALRAAIHAAAPDFAETSPPPALVVSRDDACAFLRAAFRIWVTEVRPLVRGGEGGCACGCRQPLPAGCDCVFLGQVDLGLTRTLENALQVASLGDVEIDEADRPYVASVRLLQEWLLCGGPGTGQLFAGGPPGPQGPKGEDGKDGKTGKTGPPGPSLIVAAGAFDADGNSVFDPFGDLKAVRDGSSAVYSLAFDGMDTDAGHPYVVKGSPLSELGDPAHTFEVLPRAATGEIVVRVGEVNNPAKAPARGFMVEILDLKRA